MFIYHAIRWTFTRYYIIRDGWPSLMLRKKDAFLSHMSPRSVSNTFKARNPVSSTNMLSGANPSYGFVLQLAFEEVDFLLRGPYITQTTSKTHACYWGPHSLLEKLLGVLIPSSRSPRPSRSIFPSRGANTLGELFPCPKVSDFEGPIYLRGTSRPLYEAPLVSTSWSPWDTSCGPACLLKMSLIP